METLTQVQQLVILLVPVIVAITLHEAAHAVMARWLGDPTAARLGRVSLNPFKHVDLIGTVLVPAVAYWLGGLLFGWAKPVPIDWRYFRRQRLDVALVAVAGPLANGLMALGWGTVILLGLECWQSSYWCAQPLVLMGASGVFINVLLLVLNLFPLLPLDGGRILHALLPPRLAWQFSRIEPYGMLILLALLVSGVLGRWMWPVIGLLVSWMPGGRVVTELYFVR